jgi:Na+/H+-dicarboxylate symporter
MGRSATNVIGNALATAVVGKWEGERLPPYATLAALDAQPAE